MSKTKQPVYLQIALDVASRIAKNELEEGARISGRSVMSSEYGVSPETIRRAMKILKEEHVVDVKNNAGIIVMNKERAIQYVESASSFVDVTELRHKLNRSIKKRRELDAEIESLIEQIVDLTSRFTSSDPLSRFEYRISTNSPLAGQSAKDAQFFQKTGMTIVAINRNGEMILTPDPNDIFQVHDILILMGHLNHFNNLEKWYKD